MNRTKHTFIVLTILFLAASVFAVAPPDDAKAIKIAGGERHSIVVIEDSNSAYTCGDNGQDPTQRPTYYGVLGIGSSNYTEEYTLVRVHDGN